jgi:isopentenyldiphosphate isomerase
MADMTAAQDPDELFDVVTIHGDPTGVAKRRADVHRDGDWHRAIHIWIVSQIDGDGSIIFQRRSLTKDTSPGALDPTVGGHLTSGETLEEAFREAEEEIGIAIASEAAVPVGRRIGINENDVGIRDRELQDVYFVRDDRPLAEYRPNPAELDALIRVPLGEFLDLLAGHRASAPTEIISSHDYQVSRDVLTMADFPRRPIDTYRYRVAIAASSMLRGERHFSV